jgi:hypothetical protein
MIVYRIIADPDYQSFDTANRDRQYVSGEYLHFMCRRQGENWKAPELYVPEPLLPRGDFAGLQGRDPIVVRDRVYQEFLVGVIDPITELLPLEFEGERWWVINVLRCINALNLAESDIPGHRAKLRGPGGDKYVFYDYRLPECPLFKIPETMVNQILMVHGNIHEDYDLKNICERHGLTGLKFVELWRNE